MSLRGRSRFAIAALIGALAPCLSPANDLFESKIRPLLAEKCFACHGEAQMSGLRLDSREAVLKGGTRGAAIAAGDPDNSLLINAVRHADPKLKMPPTGRLEDSEIAALEAWIREGALWPQASPATATSELSAEAKKFWSFQPVRKPAAPAVSNASWARGDVDRFILACLEKEGLEPAPPADKRTLIRRATFDLIGLPPTPEEVDAFLADDSPQAFEEVVERLLESPHYGERWGRHWLDVARYADGASGPFVDSPLTNAYRYRDWVVEAFNADMPYDRFITAQLAADLLPEEERAELLPALGFHALRGKDDDRVDVTGRAFLSLTVGCAQCHDHKFDPIPTQDFYSLQGVFSNSQPHEYPLAPEDEVEAYKKANKRVAEKKTELDEFLREQSDQVVDILITQTERYLMAAWRIRHGAADTSNYSAAGLDAPTLERWIGYLDESDREHPYLDELDALYRRGGTVEEAREVAASFSRELLKIHREKRGVDDRNYVKLGGREGARDQKTLLNTNLDFIEPVKWYLWRDLGSGPFTKDGYPFRGGVLYNGGDEVKRFLNGLWRDRLETLEANLKELEQAVPPPYPFIHGYRDAEKPKDEHVAIRGDRKNSGELAPRRFLRVLSQGEPKPFERGSGRLELARTLASPDNPLTARVMVNRVWQGHFGRGIVASPSNFGRMGEPPTHPELLDYLAARFVESGWSVKAMHREMMLSATYRLGAQHIDRNYEKDADNKRLWRANLRKRLDAETLRDAMLAVAGNLKTTAGGPAKPLSDEFARRTIYATVSRTRPDNTMTLFDFPDPKTSAPDRSVTLGPLQRLYFLNNSFVVQQAEALAARVEKEAGQKDEARVRRAYELLYARPPEPAEVKMALEFLNERDDAWPRYAQMLLASAEFSSVQ